jgi:hypothetical protein
MSVPAAGWSTGQRTLLALAFGAMFVTVVLLAGREPRANAETPAGDPRPSEPVTSTPLTPAPASQAATRSQEDRARMAVAELPAPSAVEVADLSRQVMPVDETTAEENEQRGDAIRRLSAAPAADTAQPLIYALRNDVDIRNRILAIDGLRRAALAGNSDRGIDDALVDASRSSDEVIASQARQALAEIEHARPRR